MTKTTITINGRIYDAITGMPVANVASKDSKQAQNWPRPVHAQAKPKAALDITAAPKKTPAPRTNRTVVAHKAIHQAPQKSQTLYRKALKKPAAPVAVAPRPQLARSPMISRFGASVPTKPQKAHAPQPAPHKPQQELRPAMQHPAVVKALQKNQAVAQQKIQQPQPTGTQLKEQLIKERLDQMDAASKKPAKKTSWLSRQPRIATVLTTSLAVLVLGGYLTYITLPTISLKVAASRAGVSASLPEYKPDGYSINGPITYSPGKVIIAYKSNTNDTGYKITQKATNWDSKAVLENYVEPQTDSHLPFQERGLTIYVFGTKAAWVNGGLLYTLEGDAALSSEQIRRIATSM